MPQQATIIDGFDLQLSVVGIIAAGNNAPILSLSVYVLPPTAAAVQML